jgi:hypothetical protein
VLCLKLLGEDRSVRRGVVMVKHPGLFSPKFRTTSWHVLTQLPQNVAVEPWIHNLTCWDRCLTLPQLLHRWRHQSGIFWIQPFWWELTCEVGEDRPSLCLPFLSLHFSHLHSGLHIVRQMDEFDSRWVLVWYKWRGKPKYFEKKLPHGALSTQHCLRIEPTCLPWEAGD